jgi:hypothetical protein
VLGLRRLGSASMSKYICQLVYQSRRLFFSRFITKHSEHHRHHHQQRGFPTAATDVETQLCGSDRMIPGTDQLLLSPIRRPATKNIFLSLTCRVRRTSRHAPFGQKPFFFTPRPTILLNSPITKVEVLVPIPCRAENKGGVFNARAGRWAPILARIY